METFIAVCLAILVLELGILVAVLAVTLLQVKKAAQAVEVLAYRVDHQVVAIGDAVRSGWLQMFSSILNLAGRYFAKNP